MSGAVPLPRLFATTIVMSNLEVSLWQPNILAWSASYPLLQQCNAMNFVAVDLLALATNPSYFNSLTATNITTPEISLLSYDSSFPTVRGETATGRKIQDVDWEAFHEAGIYNKLHNALYISSNYQNLVDNINITVLNLDDYSISSTQFPDLAEANGGSSYHPPGSDHTRMPSQQAWCDEGTFDEYSKLVAVDPVTNTSTVLINNFLGKSFSSVNDVRQHPITGDLWFTDADYGFFRHFRPEPVIPKHVYRFEPTTGIIDVVADGFVQSNGLVDTNMPVFFYLCMALLIADGSGLQEFSPDLRTLYITDSGAREFSVNQTSPATIYSFTVSEDHRRLSNRTTFAYVDKGFPDGIHCDTDGNVWAGIGDGVAVWNSQGKMLGRIFIGETSNNFAFAPGKLFVFSNYRLWVVENFKPVGREVCKDFGELSNNDNNY